MSPAARGGLRIPQPKKGASRHHHQLVRLKPDPIRRPGGACRGGEGHSCDVCYSRACARIHERAMTWVAAGGLPLTAAGHASSSGDGGLRSTSTWNGVARGLVGPAPTPIGCLLRATRGCAAARTRRRRHGLASSSSLSARLASCSRRLLLLRDSCARSSCWRSCATVSRRSSTPERSSSRTSTPQSHARFVRAMAGASPLARQAPARRASTCPPRRASERRVRRAPPTGARVASASWRPRDLPARPRRLARRLPPPTPHAGVAGPTYISHMLFGHVRWKPPLAEARRLAHAVVSPARPLDVRSGLAGNSNPLRETAARPQPPRQQPAHVPDASTLAAAGGTPGRKRCLTTEVEHHVAAAVGAVPGADHRRVLAAVATGGAAEVGYGGSQRL
jgi:hypothetical protein